MQFFEKIKNKSFKIIKYVKLILYYVINKLKICQEENITTKIMNFFFIDCPCCLFYRGFGVGFATGVLIGLTIALLNRLL